MFYFILDVLLFNSKKDNESHNQVIWQQGTIR